MIEVSIQPDRLVARQEVRLTVRFSNTGNASCTDIIFKLGLPSGLLLISGRNVVEIPKIPAGHEHIHVVAVEPTSPGEFEVVSRNFSYREGGVPRRERGFSQRLVVVRERSVAQPTEPRAALRIEQSGGGLALGEWDVLRLSATNMTGVPLTNVSISASGAIKTDGSHFGISSIAAGASVEVTFAVFAAEAGRHVPITVRSAFAYVGESGVRHQRQQEDQLKLTVAGQRMPPDGTSVGQTILYLSASPRDLAPLRSDEEMRKVKERLQLGRYRDNFTIEPCLAARLADLSQALIDHEPQIVHFSGHGQQDGSVYVEDEMGYSDPLAPDGLAALFALHAATVRCVIVNACHSMRLAEAMVKHIDYVVGMRSEIGDEAAILFSVGFYQALSSDWRVPEAFQRGCALIRAKQASAPEHKIPVLLTRSGS